MDLLGLEIFFDAPRAEFAAEAGLLVAAPRCFDVRGLHVVDPYNARAQRLHHTEGLEYIASPHCSSQAIRRVVGNLHGIFFVVEWDHRRNRAEDFFACDAGAIVDVVKDRGLHVVALGELLGAPAAEGELGFFLAHVKVRANTVVLFLADQRAHLGVAIERRAQLDLFRFLGHGIDEFLVNRLLDQDAAACRTDLALVDEDAEQRAVDGGLEIGVGEKDVGRLASEFKRDAFHSVRRLLHDDLADRRAAREGNFVHVGMLYERGAGGFSEAGNDVYDSRRKPNLAEPFRKLECRQGRLLGGFQHAGAPGGQRGRQFPGGHQQRVIPRDDLPCNADRFFHGEADCVVGHRVHEAKNLRGQAAVILEASRGVVDVVFSFDNRLAGVAALELGQHREVLANLVGQAEQNPTALLRRSCRPRALCEGSLGGGHYTIDVVGVRVRHLRNDFFGSRIVDGEGFRGLARDPFPVDVHLVRFDFGLDSTGHKSSAHLMGSDFFIRSAVAFSKAAGLCPAGPFDSAQGRLTRASAPT